MFLHSFADGLLFVMGLSAVVRSPEYRQKKATDLSGPVALLLEIIQRRLTEAAGHRTPPAKVKRTIILFCR
jgi:hypothetical protein